MVRIYVMLLWLIHDNNGYSIMRNKPSTDFKFFYYVQVYAPSRTAFALALVEGTRVEGTRMEGTRMEGIRMEGTRMEGMP